MKAKTTIRSGRLAGESCRGAAVFRGVPYASVEKGVGRFRAAQPAAGWSGTRWARRRGAASPQPTQLPSWLRSYGAVPTEGWDEDCLSLDVYTPGCDLRRLPVMVWIHGGAFSHGSGSFWIYAGDRLAARGVVVVAINYRLGAFGNIDLGGIDSTSTDTNIGLRDQLAALAWVRDEIEAFGGDPDNVTVFGQSAGAMSIGALLAAPSARGLFHRAILQSGAGRNVHTAEAARAVAERLLAELGIDRAERDAIDQLRSRPASALLRAQRAVTLGHRLPLGMLAWQPSLDGELLPSAPLDAMNSPAGSEVSLLMGTNRDEWKMFTATDARRRNLDEATLRGYLSRTLERDGIALATDVDEVLDVYGKDPETGTLRSPADIWVAFQGDRVFGRPAVEFADAHAARGAATYFYRFDRGPFLAPKRIGACHSIELPFVFGTLRTPMLRAAFLGSADALAVSNRMQAAWVAFARNGDPGVDGAPVWEPYRSGSGRAQVFGGRSAQVEIAPDSLRRFWAKLSESAPAASTLAARA